MSKNLFLEEREKDTWEAFYIKPVSNVSCNLSDPDPMQRLDFINDQLYKLQNQKQVAENELIDWAFAFKNPDNYPRPVIKEMILNKELSHVYSKSTGGLITCKAMDYEGDWNKYGNAYRNPFYKDGASKQKKMEREYHEF